jgi:hypothetical protein
MRWEDFGPGRRAWEAVGSPLVGGLVIGLLVNVSELLFLVLVVGAILAGVAGGAQHAVLREAVLRGLLAGALFGLAILAGWQLGGGEDVEAIPDPPVAELLLTVVPAGPLHALGWWLRSRR